MEEGSTREVCIARDGKRTCATSLKPHSLRVNSTWALVGNLVYASCQWGILVVLAKLGSPEIVGQFALALAITAPIIMLSMLQLRAVQATDAHDTYQFGHYLALRIITSVLAILAIAAVVLFSTYRAEVAVLILAMGMFKATTSVSDAYHGLMQKCERMDCIAVAKILKGPLFLAALAVTVYVTGSVLLGVAAMTIVSVVVLLTYERGNVLRILDSEHRNASRPVWQWLRLARLAWLALPLGVVMMLLSLGSNIPRYIIQHTLGERELGYFAALAYLQVVGTMVIDALGQSAVPRLAQYYANSCRRQYLQLLARMTGLSMILGASGIAITLLLGRDLLTLLYQADYAQYANVFVWLTVASACSAIASVLGYGMTATRRFRMQLPLFASSAILTALVCSFAVPQWGLIGAAYTLIIVSVFKVIGTGAIVWSATRTTSR